MNCNLGLPGSKTYGAIDVAGDKNMLWVELCKLKKMH